MNAIIFGAIAAGLLLFVLALRRARQNEEESEFQDLGHAILEFGRAFPGEAIRELHSTTNGMAVFVRLHDNRTGLMRSLRGHYSCYLIEAGQVQVSPGADERTLKIDFVDHPHNNAAFTFKSPQIAAEVSLWLLGSLAVKLG